MLIGKVHIDKPLTDFALGYRPQGLIADQIAPVVDVPNQTDLYKIWDQADIFRRVDDRRSPGTEPNTFRLRVTSAAFFCQNYELQAPITHEQLANADPIDRLMLEQYRTQGMLDKMGMNWDLRLAALIFVTGGVGSYATPGSLWSSAANSSPVTDIEVAMDNVEDATGYRPNEIVFGGLSWRQHQRSNQARDRITPGPFANAGQYPTVQQVAAFYGVESVLIGGGYVNTAAENLALSLSRVWSNHVLVHYRTPNPSRESPTHLASFRWRNGPGGNWVVRRHEPDTLKKAETISVGYYQDERVVSSVLGFLVTSVS